MSLTRFASFASLLAATVVVAACESDCPDDQSTAVVLRLLGAPTLPADTTFDIAVFAHDQYELPPGGAPIASDTGDFVEISDVSFVAEGITVLVTPRCNDGCRRFLARLSFRRRSQGDAVIATSWLETGYRDESFTEFRWLVPSQLVTPTTPCSSCAPDETCRAADELLFAPTCEPIEVPRCSVPPLGSALSWNEFSEPDCGAACN